MSKWKKAEIIVSSALFVLIIVIVGFISFSRLVNFYVNDEIDYNEWTVDLGDKLESDVATTFWGKFHFVNLNGAVRNVLGQREMNSVVKLDNGHLILPQAERTEEEIERYANEVIEYAKFCDSLGKTLLFVQPNLKVDAEDKQLPAGIEDYSNENIDRFLEYLRNADIEVLDIRQCMKNAGMDLYEYTYATDHHWTSEGCFFAFTQIAQWIEKKTGIAAEQSVVDIGQYEIITYPKWHLGSYGQRTGKYYAGIDDYDLMVPLFDVSFVDEAGNAYSFYESAVNASVFEARDATSRYTYDNALGAPNGISTTSQKLSVLFVSDSYATGMAPYIKMAYSDYYHQYYPGGLFADHVIQLDPDVIILMPYDTSTFNSGAVFHEATAVRK